MPSTPEYCIIQSGVNILILCILNFISGQQRSYEYLSALSFQPLTETQSFFPLFLRRGGIERLFFSLPLSFLILLIFPFVVIDDHHFARARPAESNFFRSLGTEKIFIDSFK